MKRALVVAGGGGKGAFSAGVIHALYQQGIRFDVLVGVSVGALNIAVPPYHIADVWRSIRGNGDIYRLRWRYLATLGRASSLYDTSPLRSLIEQHVDVAYLRTGQREFRFITTDLERRQTVAYSQDYHPIENLLASSALPGLFPPVERAGRVFVDGGVAMNAPVGVALELGADDVTVILHGPETLEREVSGARAHEIAAAAAAVAIHANVQRDLAEARRVNALAGWAARTGTDLTGSGYEAYRVRRLRVIAPARALRGRTLTFDPEAIAEDLRQGMELGRAYAGAA